MNATFTKRTAEVFNRFMSVIAKKVDNELTRQNNSCMNDRRSWLCDKLDEGDDAFFEWIMFHNWNLRLVWRDTSNSLDTVVVGVAVEVYYQTKNTFYNVARWDYGKQNFDALIGTHHPCVECGTMDHATMVAEDNLHFCNQCFAKAMKHTEDCCCCMENNLALWYKLSCDHVIHKKCFLKIDQEPDDTRKCPLCRVKTPHYETSYL